MEEAIYLLSIVVNGKAYAEVLKEDLSYYSDREKREALASLKEQAREVSLTLEQRQWLLGNTTC